MANKSPAYTGRQLILQSLDPLRRAHLEGKIEGLEKAMRLVREKPDHSGNLLASMIQDAVSATRMTIIQEAQKADTKGKHE
jgi:hypothetical protein